MASKSDLVNKISEALTYLPKKDIEEAVVLVFDYLESELTKHNRIEIRGFGSFSIRERKFADRSNTYKTIYYRSPKNKDC
jgi:integration host factor subunit beta